MAVVLNKVQIRQKRYGTSETGSNEPNIGRISMGSYSAGSASAVALYATNDWTYVGFGQPGLFATFITGCTPCASATATAGGNTIDPPQTYTFCNATQPYGSDFLNLNLKMIRGNDYSFNIQAVLNGNPLNCNNGFLRMTAKWKATDADASAVFTVTSPSGGITWINQSQGTANITIARALTNTSAVPFHRVDLPYDIEFTNSSGQVDTIAYGTLTIQPNISQSSP